MADNPLLGEISAAAVENAAERQFGPEFEDIHILSNAQVAVILQVSARSAVNRDEELNEVYRKTQKYVERFNTMTNPEKDHQELVDELDNLQEYVPPQIRNASAFNDSLISPAFFQFISALTTFRKETDDGEELELHGFEVAALMNLVITDTSVEEAVALIPSLSRLPEAAIDEILDLIKSTMIRIVS